MKDVEETPESLAPEPEAEPVTGPPVGDLEEAPAWMKEAREGPVEAAAPQDAGAVDAQADIVVAVIDLAHDRAAEFTHYDGFRLQQKELDLWTKVVRYYLKFLPMGQWGHVIDLISLVAMEMMKIAGFVQWRKERLPAHADEPVGGELK